MDEGVYGSTLGSAFGMPDAPTLSTRVLLKSTLAVTELRYDRPDFGKSAPVPQDDAYLVVLHVNGCSESLYFEERLRQRERHSRGATSIYDLRRNPATEVHDPYRSLVFYLPRTALDDICGEAGARRIADLRHNFGASTDDAVTRHLLSSILPALAKPQEAGSLFVDYVALAITAHIARVYGGMSQTKAVLRSGLAPWQERRAKEMMTACLHEDLPLSRVAMECGLSVRHFSRAFHLSTGMPPHRWLMKERVARARDLLKARVLSLADVAHFCGFADQSHFHTRFHSHSGNESWHMASRRTRGQDYRSTKRLVHFGKLTRSECDFVVVPLAGPMRSFAPVVVCGGDRLEFDGNNLASCRQTVWICGVVRPAPFEDIKIGLNVVDRVSSQQERQRSALFGCFCDQSAAGHKNQFCVR